MVDALVDEFLEKPYLHRVEHSLHVRLIELLRHSEVFQSEHRLGRDKVSQCIHKEWPEFAAQTNRRRGNFDVSIIPPMLLERSLDARTFEDRGISHPLCWRLD